MLGEFFKLFNKLPIYLLGKCKDKECKCKTSCIENGSGTYYLDLRFSDDVKGNRQWSIFYSCRTTWVLFVGEQLYLDPLQCVKDVTNRVNKFRGRYGNK